MMRLGLGRGARRRRSLGRRWKRRRPHAANFPHHQQSLHRRSDGSDLLLGESSCTGAKNDTHLSDGGPRREEVVRDTLSVVVVVVVKEERK